MAMLFSRGVDLKDEEEVRTLHVEYVITNSRGTATRIRVLYSAC